MAFNISQRDQSGVSILSIHGRATLGIGDNAIHGAIKDLLADGVTRIVVDLEQATAIDSSGVGELVSGTVSALKAESVLVFSGFSPRVLRIFEMTGLLKCIIYCEDLDAALVEIQAMTFEDFLKRQQAWVDP